MTEEGQSKAADIRKNASEVIRVRPTEFKGYSLVDVRVWAETEQGGEATLKPTKKGICFKRGLLPDVIRALQGILEAETGGESAGIGQEPCRLRPDGVARR